MRLPARLALAAALAACASTGAGALRAQDRRPPPPSAPPVAAGQDPARDLLRQLALRPDQQPAFRDYQAAFAAPGEAADEDDDPARLAALTTPQRLDDAARQMERERADFARISAATRRLYAILDPAQRRTFDRLTAPPLDQDDDDDAPPAGRGAPQAEGRRPGGR